MYFVYILRSKRDNNFYTGITNNLARRLEEHNRGNNATPSTRTRGPFEIVYFERHQTRREARKREKFFKSGHGREFRGKILKRR